MSGTSVPRSIADATFAIVANGFADGPAQALRDYLVGRHATVVMVAHPLVPEQGKRHVVATYATGRALGTRTIWTPFRPPLSFASDPLVPLSLPRVDTWFGFNPLACARGLVHRRLRRARKVVLWSVDFTPDRFGPGTPSTRLYDRLDGFCCRHADARVELSAAARDARNRRLALDSGRTPTYVVPMGAWLDRVPTVPPDGFRRRRVVFLGHLTPGRGAVALIDAFALLRSRGSGLALDVIGGGEQLSELKQRASTHGLGEVIRFHGFVPDHREIERLLAEASIAVAPYEPSETTFSRWADPGKLKSYLAAGLPIVLTNVPPNAEELAREAGAEIVPYEPEAIADAISAALSSPDEWCERRAAALSYVRRFDWFTLLTGLMAHLDLEK